MVSNGDFERNEWYTLEFRVEICAFLEKKKNWRKKTQNAAERKTLGGDRT